MSSSLSSEVSSTVASASKLGVSSTIALKKQKISNLSAITTDRFRSVIEEQQEELADERRDVFLKAKLFSHNHIKIITKDHMSCLGLDPTIENTLTTFTNRLVKVVMDPSDVSYITNAELYLYGCLTASSSNYKRSSNRYYMAPIHVSSALLDYAIAITTNLQLEAKKKSFIEVLQKEGRFLGIGLSKLTILLCLNDEFLVVQCSVPNFEIEEQSNIPEKLFHIDDKIRYETADYIHNASRVHMDDLHIAFYCITGDNVKEGEYSHFSDAEDIDIMRGSFKDHESSIIKAILFMYKHFYPGIMGDLTMSVEVARVKKDMVKNEIICVIANNHDPRICIHNGMAGVEVFETFVNGYPSHSRTFLSAYWINILTARERKVITKSIQRIKHAGDVSVSRTNKRKIHDI